MADDERKKEVNKGGGDSSERSAPMEIIPGKVEKGSKPVIDTQPPPEQKPKEK